jgi:hypothetical protein
MGSGWHGRTLSAHEPVIAHAAHAETRFVKVRNIPERVIANSRYFVGEVITDFNDFRRTIPVNEVALRGDQQANQATGRQEVGRASWPRLLSQRCRIRSAHRRPSPRLGKAMVELRKTLKGLFDPYRPELHYMRGPGPKWREKHGNPPTV